MAEHAQSLLAPAVAAVAVALAVAVLGLVGLIAAPFVLVAVGLTTGHRSLWIAGLALAVVLVAVIVLFGVGGATGGVE